MTNPAIPIDIIFGRRLRSWTDEWNPHSQALIWQIELEVRALLLMLGIPGEPAIRAIHDEAIENLRLLVHGAVRPIPPALLQKIDQFIAEDLVRIVLEAVKQAPETLLGDGQIVAYLDGAGISQTETSPADVKSLLQALLSLRLSIRDAGRIIAYLQAGRRNGGSEIEIAEALIAEMNSGLVEIAMHPDYLKQLFKIELNKEQAVSVYNKELDEKVRDLFKMMSDGLFYELGMRVPDVKLVVNESLPGQRVIFMLNGFPSPPHEGIRTDQILVNDTPDRLKLIEISNASPAINPANGNECSLVESKYRTIAEAAGLYVWDAPGYLVLALSKEIRKNAGRMLTIEKVEFELAQLQLIYPQLIEAVLEKIPLPRLARALRTLLDEEISIRDLKGVLERLLTCDYIIADGGKNIIFDDRLVFQTEPEQGWRDNGYALAQHVRAGMKRYISHKYTRGQSTLIVYLIDPEIETILFDHLAFDRGDQSKTALTAERIEEIRSAVRDEVGILQPAASIPAILTVSSIRHLLRRIIMPEFSDLPVLAYDELSPEMNIQPIARISLG